MGALIVIAIFVFFIWMGRGILRIFFGSRNNSSGVFGFFEEFFEELFRGNRFAKTLAKLCAFFSVIVVIIILMSILI